MAMPFVTVVVPTYNRREWIRDLMASLRQQTYPPDRYEVIAVDNFSKDGTWEMLQEIEKEGGWQFRCFRNPGQRVPAASRNLGFEQARGDIIAFTDSDCVVSPEWIAEGAAAFQEGVGVVEGRTNPVPTDPRPVLCRIKTIVAGRSLFDTCNIFYTRQALTHAGGFARDFYDLGYPRYYGEDLDLGYRVKELGYQCVFADKAVVLHHNHPQTLWQWLMESRLVFICPYLAWKHPSARRELLFLRYFLSPSTALFDIGLVGLAMAIAIHPYFLLLSLPYVAAKWREKEGRRMNVPLQLARLAGATVRSFVTFVVLAFGSIRFRSLVI